MMTLAAPSKMAVSTTIGTRSSLRIKKCQPVYNNGGSAQGGGGGGRGSSRARLAIPRSSSPSFAGIAPRRPLTVARAGGELLPLEPVAEAGPCHYQTFLPLGDIFCQVGQCHVGRGCNGARGGFPRAPSDPRWRGGRAVPRRGAHQSRQGGEDGGGCANAKVLSDESGVQGTE